MLKVHELVARSVNENLFGLDFTVKDGEILAVVGLSDSGKNLLGQVLSYVAPIKSGQIHFNSYRLDRHHDKIKIQTGCVNQPVKIENYLTGFELLDLIGSIYHLSPDRRTEKILALSRDFNIGSGLYAIGESMPSATKQKIGLAAAIIHEPRLLILNEPTQYLDFHDRKIAERRITQAAQSGCSTVLITDDLNMAERLADRFLILDGGKQIAEGTLQQLHNQVKPRGRGLEAILTDLLDA